jgi:hypothetical protein
VFFRPESSCFDGIDNTKIGNVEAYGRLNSTISSIIPVAFILKMYSRQQGGVPVVHKKHFNRAEVISLFLSLRTSVLFLFFLSSSPQRFEVSWFHF